MVRDQPIADKLRSHGITAVVRVYAIIVQLNELCRCYRCLMPVPSVDFSFTPISLRRFEPLTLHENWAVNLDSSERGSFCGQSVHPMVIAVTKNDAFSMTNFVSFGGMASIRSSTFE